MLPENRSQFQSNTYILYPLMAQKPADGGISVPIYE